MVLVLLDLETNDVQTTPTPDNLRGVTAFYIGYQPKNFLSMRMFLLRDFTCQKKFYNNYNQHFNVEAIR